MKFKHEDVKFVVQIAERANDMLELGVLETMLVLETVNCEIDYPRLLGADPFNFAHDIGGIYRHLDRDTGELKDCFWPRFAK